MLVDGGLLNPLPIVPVVSSHCDLIIAVNLNATNQKHYQLPVIQPRVDIGRFGLQGFLFQLHQLLGLLAPKRARQDGDVCGQNLRTMAVSPS